MNTIQSTKFNLPYYRTKANTKPVSFCSRNKNTETKTNNRRNIYVITTATVFLAIAGMYTIGRKKIDTAQFEKIKKEAQDKITKNTKQLENSIFSKLIKPKSISTLETLNPKTTLALSDEFIKTLSLNRLSDDTKEILDCFKLSELESILKENNKRTTLLIILKQGKPNILNFDEAIRYLKS